MNILKLILVGILSGEASFLSANDSPRIALLDFELKDITSRPDTFAEKQRTASMAPLLKQALRETGPGNIMIVDTDRQKSANTSFGYLFRFHDEAARVGREMNADWIIVSQHSKPSFLFSFLWVYLVDVQTQRAIARYDIELKGRHETVTHRAIQSLARRIRQTITSKEASKFCNRWNGQVPSKGMHPDWSAAAGSATAAAGPRTHSKVQTSCAEG